SVAFSPDGSILASGSSDTTICLWDVQSQSLKGEPLTGHSSWVQSVTFSPKGNLLASGSWDNTIRLWDLQSHTLVGDPLRGHTNRVLSVTFSPDGNFLASGSTDCTVRIWNVTTLTSAMAIHTYDHHPLSIGPAWGGMYDDGWIRSTTGELILWVPASYRAKLDDKRLITILGHDMSSRVRLNFDQVCLGEDWTKCYNPPSS
ncbi:WD40 repeat-like protein, partial [Clavulina sp. PMI_390]